MHVLIIGNGISGVSAAMEIRRLKPTWKITMISGESPFFFSRPALMYLYMGHMSFEDTKPYEDWTWERLGIDLVQDWVLGVETKRARVLTKLGGPIGYDKLLIATGSKPNKFGWPGQDLKRVQGFYDLQDLEQLEMNTAGLRTAVITGGGLIGIELAECLHSRGAQVIMLARESSYWNNILPLDESQMVTDVIRSAGINLQLERELAEIVDNGNGEASAVVTKDGERIECQLVGLTAGVSPNLSSIQGSAIETGRGVLVDERFSTNVDNVFAAGDCAEIVTPEGQRNTQEQLWYTGKMQGAIAGRIIAGKEDRYDRGIWYNSAKFVDLEWHTYGRVPGELMAADAPSLYWEHEDRRHCLRIAHNDGKITGMNAMGIRHRHRVWERWIAEERDVGYVLEHLREANFDPELFHRFEPSVVASLREQLR